uniref:Uncharacterized protein n=1 Tax=Cyanothece sp. (strain PCC 7425 / ATCC 29141) TaxID=395961 RepID=B8HJP3_CYAP4
MGMVKGKVQALNGSNGIINWLEQTQRGLLGQSARWVTATIQATATAAIAPRWS